MRIVAGEFKGRRLEGPPGRGTRPTSDKVREALFSILGEIDGLQVLDLFAGTGALALEALSRGAAGAVLVERDRRVAAVAERNAAAALGEARDRARIVRADALKFGGGEQRFDLVFIDPPYAEADQLGPRLAAMIPDLLAAGARVVTESDRRSPLELPGSALALESEHRYGDTLLRIFHAL